MRLIFRATSLAFLVLFVSACAAGTGSSSTSGNRDVITQVEMSQVAGAETAYDVVQRLRPRWLTGRGQNLPRVFVDGVEMGDTGQLRNYRIQVLNEIRYTQPSDATMRYGTGFGGGVIEVITR